MWLDLSIKNILNESTNRLDSDFLNLSWVLVFLHLCWHDNSDGWKILLNDTHELSESLLDTVENTAVSEKNLTLVGLGSLLEGLEIISSLINFLLEEDHGVLLVTEDCFDLILGELEDGWHHEWLDEVHELILVWGTSVNVDVFTLGIFLMRLAIWEGLEVSEKNNLWLIIGDSDFSKARAWEMDELNLVLSIGVWDMSLGEEIVIGWAKVSNKEFLFFIQSWQFLLHAQLE